MKIGRIAFLVLCLLIGCEQTVEPDNNDSLPIDPAPSVLTADAGPDQSTIVGSYAILNASDSSPGEGEKIVWYEWEEEENNPADVKIRSGGTDNCIAIIGFITEGIYKFTLVVRDGIEDSAPDEVVVTVEEPLGHYFKDLNLEIQVRYALKKQTEQLPPEVLLSLDSLDVNLGIAGTVTSLKGLETCTNLEYLDVERNEITDLTPLTNLTKLTYLSLSQNHDIRYITPLARLTNLRCLDLNRCDVADITALKNLTQITVLNLLYNERIRDISAIANMRDLEELWLSWSPIGDISPVAELTELWRLWVANCEITDIGPVANLTKLRTLYLKFNNISDLSPLTGLAQLERLYLSQNQITDITPLQNQNLTGLPYLVIDRNQIVDVSPLKYLTSWGLVSLSRNQVEDIAPLLENTSLDTGSVLFLRNNPLNEVSINVYIPELVKRGVSVSF